MYSGQWRDAQPPETRPWLSMAPAARSSSADMYSVRPVTSAHPGQIRACEVVTDESPGSDHAS